MKRQNGGGVQLQQRPAELQIQQNPAQVEIKPTLVQVKIDQSAAWADRGLAGNEVLRANWKEEAKSAILEGIARVASAGDRMARQRNAIPAIAEDTCWRDYEFNVDTIPKHMPRIDVVGAEQPEIEITPGEVQVDIQPNAPEITFRPDALRIYLEQREALAMRYEPLIDTRI